MKLTRKSRVTASHGSVTLDDIKYMIYDAALNQMTSPSFGFPEDEAKEYLFVDVDEVGQDKTMAQYIRIEVRAEVSYEGMEKLAEVLNPIVARFDEDAYFDFDEPGIMSAYIEKAKIESSTDITTSNKPEIWTVYYYEDDPSSGFKVGSKEEAYELRDDLGDEYEAAFLDYGTVSYDEPDTSKDDWFIVDTAKNLDYVRSNSEDDEVWYIDKAFRGDSFERWLFNAYELHIDELYQAELPAYYEGYKRYKRACEYSDEVDGKNGSVEACGKTKMWEDGKSEPVEESKEIAGSDYGGAFDIDPESFWTKEDIVEFGYEVEDILNEMPDMKKYRLRFTDTYIVDYNRLVVDFEDMDGNSFASNTIIDMRRIRSPKDLIKKYARAAATEIRNDVEDFYIDAEVDWNYVDSSEDVNAGIELPIDPPEYDPPQDREGETEIEVDVSQHIQVAKDGSVYFAEGYEDEYKQYTERRYYGYAFDDQEVYIGDAQDIAQDIEALFDEPNIQAQMPAYAGVYLIEGTFELVYKLRGDYYPSDDYYESNDVTDIETEFLPDKSYVLDLVIK